MNGLRQCWYRGLVVAGTEARPRGLGTNIAVNLSVRSPYNNRTFQIHFAECFIFSLATTSERFIFSGAIDILLLCALCVMCASGVDGPAAFALLFHAVSVFLFANTA